MWEVIGSGLSLLRVLFGYFVTKKNTKEDLKQASNAFARAKSGVNESAEDREDILSQKQRLENQSTQDMSDKKEQ